MTVPPIPIVNPVVSPVVNPAVNPPVNPVTLERTANVAVEECVARVTSPLGAVVAVAPVAVANDDVHVTQAHTDAVLIKSNGFGSQTTAMTIVGAGNMRSSVRDSIASSDHFESYVHVSRPSEEMGKSSEMYSGNRVIPEEKSVHDSMMVGLEDDHICNMADASDIDDDDFYNYTNNLLAGLAPIPASTVPLQPLPCSWSGYPHEQTEAMEDLSTKLDLDRGMDFDDEFITSPASNPVNSDHIAISMPLDSNRSSHTHSNSPLSNLPRFPAPLFFHTPQHVPTPPALPLPPIPGQSLANPMSSVVPSSSSQPPDLTTSTERVPTTVAGADDHMSRQDTSVDA